MEGNGKASPTSPLCFFSPRMFSTSTRNMESGKTKERGVAGSSGSGGQSRSDFDEHASYTHGQSGDKESKSSSDRAVRNDISWDISPFLGDCKFSKEHWINVAKHCLEAKENLVLLMVEKRLQAWLKGFQRGNCE